MDVQLRAASCWQGHLVCLCKDAGLEKNSGLKRWPTWPSVVSGCYLEWSSGQLVVPLRCVTVCWPVAGSGRPRAPLLASLHGGDVEGHCLCSCTYMGSCSGSECTLCMADSYVESVHIVIWAAGESVCHSSVASSCCQRMLHAFDGCCCMPALRAQLTSSSLQQALF